MSVERGTMPIALDLFCGPGGASRGLIRAGFEVVGVDIAPQPAYPGAVIVADALSHFRSRSLRGFVEDNKVDFVWASPPCQFATAYKRRPGHVRPSPNLIPETRALLETLPAGVPWVIENVWGAREHLRDPLKLCGCMFPGLTVQRWRAFEFSPHFYAQGPWAKLRAKPWCSTDPHKSRHESLWPARWPAATNRGNARRTLEIGSYRVPLRVQHWGMGLIEFDPVFPADRLTRLELGALERQIALICPNPPMTRHEISQAVPPAYAQHIGLAALRAADLP